MVLKNIVARLILYKEICYSAMHSLLITFTNRQSLTVSPPGLIWIQFLFDIRMVFLKDFFRKSWFWKISRRQISMKSFQGQKINNLRTIVRMTFAFRLDVEPRLNQFGPYALGLPNILLMEKNHTHTYGSSFSRIIRWPSRYYTVFDARKPVFGGLKKTQAQTSLCSLISAFVIRFFESI